MELIKTIMQHDIDGMIKLLDQGADVNYKSAFGMTPLSMATIVHNNTAISRLIEYGADISNHDALHNALHNAVDNKTLKGLIKHGTKFPSNVNGYYALIKAIDDDDVELIGAFLDAGADVNSVNTEGGIPLVYAIEKANISIIKTLLARGADAKYKNDHGGNLIFAAVHKDNADKIISLLVNYGADINERNCYHRSILHSAMIDNNLNLVKTLLELGVNINSKDINDKTALSCTDDETIIRLLISRGANIYATHISDALRKVIISLQNQWLRTFTHIPNISTLASLKRK